MTQLDENSLQSTWLDHNRILKLRKYERAK